MSELAGECAKCGNLNRLNAEQLCPACGDAITCANHGDIEAAAHCLRCGRPFCVDCLGRAVCPPCKDRAAKTLEDPTASRRRPGIGRPRPPKRRPAKKA